MYYILFIIQNECHLQYASHHYYDCVAVTYSWLSSDHEFTNEYEYYKLKMVYLDI